MKTSTYLLLASLIPFGLKAQDESRAIQQWQSLHPTTLLISSERFNSLSEEERALLGNNYIVFQDKITLEQLQQYDAAVMGASVSDKPVQDKDNSFYIKQWLADHPQVMLIKQSVFQAMDEAKQQECINNPTILVLQGEVLTANDLYDYEH